MAGKSERDPGQRGPEEPTGAATLTIQVGSPQVHGRVPHDQAPLLIMLGSCAAGIGGAVLTLQIAPAQTDAAYAELALAFVVAVLIAVCGTIATVRAGRPRSRGRELPRGQGRSRGKGS